VIELAPGTAGAVRVPATSANLGPGFDCLGLALDIYDEYRVEVVARPGVVVDSVGECAEFLPTDERHLVARALVRGLAAGGYGAAGLRLRCRNAIPQGRGLGSSSAAIVGGLLLADTLMGRDDPEALVAAAGAMEGHPDNVAPAALGGLTIAWTHDGTARAVRLELAAAIRPVVFLPSFTSPTDEARAALPEQVPHQDAAFNAARAALLVLALTARTGELFVATEDRLHQEQRRATYPDAMALVDRLRADRVPAVISGAGPAVLALASAQTVDRVVGFGSVEFVARAVAVGAAATRI
jgi:homoserine kinase